MAALAVRTTLYRNAAARIARTRRAHRVAAAVALGVLLLGPSRLATNGAPAREECPAPELADIVGDASNDAGTGGPKPQPGQQKARSTSPHCDPSYAVVVNGYCWLELKQAPPHCLPGSVAFRDSCLAPVAEKARAPSSFMR